MKLRDLMPPGQSLAAGTHVFTAERIIEFASEFDPHFFHLDAERAKQSLFGGLCASGWHVCTVAMQASLRHILSEAGRPHDSADPPPSLAAPGSIRNLKWLKPVYAGDTVTFSVQYAGETPHPDLPDLEFCILTYEGINQNGERVMRLDCTVADIG